jgi:hypothetical protein
MTISDTEWMAAAACRNLVSHIWDDNTPTPQATSICFRCPVQLECVGYGLRRVYGSDAGVLGGLGLYDRQRVRARRWTLHQAWRYRLAELVAHDWDRAIAEDRARRAPRLELT